MDTRYETAISTFYLFCAIRSVLKVVDSSGTVKNSYSYNPYGNSLNKSETVSNPWQFASGYYDANTGLYKFGTRYYDPQQGRWTQKDPVSGSIGSIGSGNPFVYAGDEPTMQADPSGRDSNPACAGAIGGLLLGVYSAIQTVPWLLGVTGSWIAFAGLASTPAILGFLAGLAAAFAWAVFVVAVILVAIGTIYAIYVNCR